MLSPTQRIYGRSEGQHDSPGHEGVGLVRGVWEQGEPSTRAVNPTVEPEGMAQVGLVAHGAAAAPQSLTA